MEKSKIHHPEILRRAIALAYVFLVLALGNLSSPRYASPHASPDGQALTELKAHTDSEAALFTGPVLSEQLQAPESVFPKPLFAIPQIFNSFYTHQFLQNKAQYTAAIPLRYKVKRYHLFSCARNDIPPAIA